MQEIGKKIREARSKKGLSQEQLAERLRISQAGVSKLESGKTVPTVSRLMQIARVLDIPLRQLLV